MLLRLYHRCIGLRIALAVYCMKLYAAYAVRRLRRINSRK